MNDPKKPFYGDSNKFIHSLSTFFRVYEREGGSENYPQRTTLIILSFFYLKLVINHGRPLCFIRKTSREIFALIYILEPPRLIHHHNSKPSTYAICKFRTFWRKSNKASINLFFHHKAYNNMTRYF
jgi:hypothetical protein